MGLFSRITARIDRFSETIQNVGSQQIERDLRACGLLNASESVAAMAEAYHLNQRRTQWGNVWVITEEKTIVWLPRERRPLLVARHDDASTFTGGNFSAGVYVAYVVDLRTRQNLIKDHFMNVPEQFAGVLDGMRVEEEQRRLAPSVAAGERAVDDHHSEQRALTDHVDEMTRLGGTLRQRKLISVDEVPICSSSEVEIDEDGIVRGQGQYSWVFTDRALHIIGIPVGEQQQTKVSLDFLDPGWTIQLKSNPDDRRTIIGLIRQGGVGRHGGALLATDDMFTARLMLLLRERPE
jgi:hypothetical protein